MEYHSFRQPSSVAVEPRLFRACQNCKLLYRFTENRLDSQVNIGRRDTEIITGVSMHFGEFARFKVLLPNGDLFGVEVQHFTAERHDF